MSLSRLKWAAIISFVVSILLLLGGAILPRTAWPPIPERWLIRKGRWCFRKATSGRPGCLPAVRPDGSWERVGPWLTEGDGVFRDDPPHSRRYRPEFPRGKGLPETLCCVGAMEMEIVDLKTTRELKETGMTPERIRSP